MMILQRWAASAVKGSSMERINLPFFYQLGTQLSSLTKMIVVEPTKRLEVYINCITLRPTLNYLFSSFSALTVCRPTGNDLISAIDDIEGAFQAHIGIGQTKETETGFSIDVDVTVSAMYQRVLSTAKKFETVLSEELQTLATYHVTQKGIYLTPHLIDRAELVLPPDVLLKTDQRTKDEIRESGRCLAFDNFTASGFHIIRATECVIHKYYLAVCNPSPAPDWLGSWGAYISKLHDLGRPEVEEIVALLQQIKGLHRNLIMHPEIVLNFNEAYTLFEVSKAAIIAMASKLPELQK
jgi:hypothetical protein